MAHAKGGKALRHNKKHDQSPLTGIGETIYRKVVNNSGSKTLALTELLDNFSFVRIEVLHQDSETITIKITEVKE